MTAYTQELLEDVKLNDGFSKPNEIFVCVWDGTKWVEIEGVEYFKVTKRLNQMSQFEMELPQIETAEKVYVKEFAKVMLFSNNVLILKGRIQKMTYETSNSAKIEGFGMEATILDKEFKKSTASDPDRIQYDNTSAQTIAKELLSTSANGLTPWTMTPRSSGLYTTDYGQISMRFEFANKLTALGTLANTLKYDWWIDHDPISYTNDYFNMSSIKGNQTSPSGDLNRSFTITGDYVNAEGTDYQRDVTNVANFIKVNGYGDGINQISTSTYNASPIYTTLATSITASSTSIVLIDASAFASSGTIRIMEEIITYTGKSTNTLTGCTRGTSSTTAKVHKAGVYIEKYVVYTSPEANSSISTNGLMELTLNYKEVRDEPTLELIASNELIDRMSPIERITITPTDPQAVAETLQTGDLVSVVDAESSLNSNYRIVGIIYENSYGNLSVTLEASNKSLTFIEQLQKEREKNQALQKYMQGATNIYVLSNQENLDSSHASRIMFYLPSETIAINKLKASFKMKNYRADSTSTTSAPSFQKQTGMWFANGCSQFAYGLGTTQVMYNPSTSTLVGGLSMSTGSFVSSLSSDSNFIRTSGGNTYYSPNDFVNTVSALGVVTSWWDTAGGVKYLATTGSTVYNATAYTSYGTSSAVNNASWSNYSGVTGYSTVGAYTSKSTFTWTYPLYIQINAPNLAGTFDRIRVNGVVHNGTDSSRTPTIYLKRNGSTIATYTPTIVARGYYYIDWEDTVDYRNYSYRLEITSSTGFDVNTAGVPDVSWMTLDACTYNKSIATLNYGIYENTTEFTPPGTIIVSAGPYGSEVAVGTYTSDQSDVDFTNKYNWVAGNWYCVKFDSNHANNTAFGGRMRIEANLITQIFIESK